MVDVADPHVVEAASGSFCPVADDADHTLAEIAVGLEQVDQANCLVVGADDDDVAAVPAPLAGTGEPCPVDGSHDAQGDEGDDGGGERLANVPVVVVGHAVCEQDDAAEQRDSPGCPGDLDDPDGTDPRQVEALRTHRPHTGGDGERCDHQHLPRPPAIGVPRRQSAEEVAERNGGYIAEREEPLQLVPCEER